MKTKKSVKKATKKFKDFNQYEPELKKIKLPDIKALVRLGNIENLEYISDKAIFKKDKKTRKRKIRTYIHNFREFEKYPYLFTNQDGNILIIYDPDKKIQVEKEGII